MKAPGAVRLRGKPRPQVDQAYLAMAAAHMSQLGKSPFADTDPQAPPVPLIPQAQDAEGK